ncbi:hypothetical protein [[Mycoplasma] testudinis]|uniref:hypothetical protein n=1 Tax=[Mycoplasma] testudinis TaxID=33924 RepID=UPI00047FA583|nr:hypothetical protein [[Mycoplasma] testudinis]
MAGNNYKVKILTPRGVKFDEEVRMMEVKAPEGYIALMANNAPFVANVKPNVIYITHPDGEREPAILDQGTVYATRTEAKIFCLDFVYAKDVDVVATENEKRELEARLAALQDLKEKIKVERLLAFELLKLREGPHK